MNPFFFSLSLFSLSSFPFSFFFTLRICFGDRPFQYEKIGRVKKSVNDPKNLIKYKLLHASFEMSVVLNSLEPHCKEYWNNISFMALIGRLFICCGEFNSIYISFYHLLHLPSGSFSFLVLEC